LSISRALFEYFSFLLIMPVLYIFSEYKYTLFIFL
jgi:hypothetical protein